MSRVDELLKEKENLILDISNRLISWNGSTDHALQILSENDEKFKRMSQLDRQVSAAELNTFNEKYRNHWQKLINTQQELMQAIQVGQDTNQEQLSQIDNKQKIVQNYMSVKNKSIFIEKDY